MRLKHCNWRGCTKLVKQGQSFCDEHLKADLKRKQAYISAKTKRESTVKGRQLKLARLSGYNANTRDPEANAFYHSAKWQHMRDYVYSRDLATCRVCGQALSNRKIIDHIHPLKVAPNEKLDKDNLWTLCYRCHNIKTNLEQTIKAQPNGSTKLKHISRDWWVKAIKEKIK